ncbi:peptidase M14 [Mycena rebaudengoi]|nr:peptidase M14 [Mycena rebaudengoi]
MASINLRNLILGTFISLPCVVTALSQGGQHIFDAPSSGVPILRRFSTNDSESLEEVLRIAQARNLDIWQIGPESSPYVDIYSPPQSSPLPPALLAVPHSTSNIDDTIPRTRLRHHGPQDWGLGSLENTTFHDEYHPLWEIDAFIHEMARLHPDSVNLLRLGHSAQEREMMGMKISSPNKKQLVAEAGHAREWVATSSSLYLAHALLSNASEPHSLSHLLDVYDFHIVPAPNPDGYVYTWETDRFWYKNRQIVGPGAKCIGIDMNRNWGFHWKPHSDGPLFSGDLNKKKKKKKKEPADPCSHWYPGHREFEAPEVNNIANYITAINGVGKGANKGGVVAFVDLRSYGQMLAIPYSYKCKRLPQDAEDQMEALLGAAQAGRQLYGTPFATGSLCELLYRAPGNMVDYIYKRASIKYTYAAFLRDTGTYGFALPPELIRPVGEETGGIIEYLANFIVRQKK